MAEWHEKEARFGEHAPSRNIWRYIPKKLYEAVENAVVDLDGYWIYLNTGWTAYDGGEDCGLIHDFTISDLKASIKTIRKKEARA